MSSEEKCGLPACVIALKISEEVARCFYPLRSLDKIENGWSFSSHFQLSLEGDPEFIGFEPTEQNQTKTCRDSITCVFSALHFSYFEFSFSRAYLFLCSNRLVMITLGLALWHQKWSSSRDNMIIIEWFITEKPFIYMKEIFMYCYQWVVARMSFRAALTWHVTSLTFLNKCGFQTFSLFTVRWLQLRESSRKFWLVIVTISNHSCRHGIRQNVECQLPGFAAFISEELS